VPLRNGSVIPHCYCFTHFRAAALCNARVPHAIGQSFDWLVSAEAELLGARVADRPPAFPLAEAQAAGPARFCRLARRARAAAIDYPHLSDRQVRWRLCRRVRRT
jgi:hypothetical protein